MLRLAVLFAFLVSAAIAHAQTVAPDVDVPKWAPIELDGDALMFPGGPHTTRYRRAVATARELEAGGDFAAALTSWKTAHLEVQQAVADKEFGTTRLFPGIGNVRPVFVPLGTERIAQVATAAANAAFNARLPTEAVAWADDDIELIRSFEATARKAGSVADADIYASRLAVERARDLDDDLDRVERQRQGVWKVSSSALGVMLGLSVAAGLFRRRRRRPPFVYRKSGFVPHNLRSPRPKARFPLVIGAAAVVSAAGMIVHGCGIALGQRAMMWALLGAVVGSVGAWIVAVHFSGNGWLHDDEPLDGYTTVGGHNVPELLAWFEANERELRSDFAEVSPISDHDWSDGLRAALALFLGRDGEPPSEWDGAIIDVVADQPIRWEPLLTPYLKNLERVRCQDMLHRLGDGARLFSEPLDAALVAVWLEHAMITSRRWEFGAWKTKFMDGPYRACAEGVVWVAFDGPKPLSAFVISPDGDLVDVSLDEVRDPSIAGTSIGVAHPADLEDSRTWADVIADFEMQTPFDQLHRPDFPQHSGDIVRLDWRLSHEQKSRLENRGRFTGGTGRAMRPYGVFLCWRIHAEHVEIWFVAGYRSDNRILDLRHVPELARREAYVALRRVRGE